MYDSYDMIRRAFNDAIGLEASYYYDLGTMELVIKVETKKELVWKARYAESVLAESPSAEYFIKDELFKVVDLYLKQFGDRFDWSTYYEEV